MLNLPFTFIHADSWLVIHPSVLNAARLDTLMRDQKLTALHKAPAVCRKKKKSQRRSDSKAVANLHLHLPKIIHKSGGANYSCNGFSSKL